MNDKFKLAAIILLMFLSWQYFDIRERELRLKALNQYIDCYKLGFTQEDAKNFCSLELIKIVK